MKKIKLNIQLFASSGISNTVSAQSVAPASGSYIRNYIKFFIAWSSAVTASGNRNITMKLYIQNTGLQRIQLTGVNCLLGVHNVTYSWKSYSISGTRYLSANASLEIGTQAFSVSGNATEIPVYASTQMATTPNNKITIRAVLSSGQVEYTYTTAGNFLLSNVDPPSLPIIINGNTVQKVNFNGTDVSHVYFNGTQLY